jgi:hypothetical protein
VRFILALGLLLVAFVVQFWATTFNVPLDLALAALFAFALAFDWPELLFFVALAALVLDWRPLLSAPLLIYVFLPLLLLGFHRIFSINAWLCLLAAVAIGVGALAATAGFSAAFAHGGALFIDVAAGFCFAWLSFLVLGHFS